MTRAQLALYVLREPGTGRYEIAKLELAICLLAGDGMLELLANYEQTIVIGRMNQIVGFKVLPDGSVSASDPYSWAVSLAETLSQEVDP